MHHSLRLIAAALLVFVTASSRTAHAAEFGPVTKLPLPRFVSIKAKPANVRAGPGIDYPIKWVFVRRGLPLEITAEFGQWRRIRDWEGKDGWMLGALLTGRRMALATPWRATKKVPLRSRGKSGAQIVALAQPDVLLRIRGCNGQWCEVRAGSRYGFVRQTSLWGAYPREKF